MTAEIAILNREGLALAADSAVTILQHQRTKIFNGANKLFALSKNQPVAVMIYNNTTLNGVPWEIIIKSYRKKINSSNFATLEMYSEDFFKYVKSYSAKIPDNEKLELCLFKFASFMEHFRTLLFREAEKINARNNGITLRAAQIAINKIAKIMENKIKERVEKHSIRLSKNVLTKISEVIEYYLESFPIPRQTKDSLILIAKMHLLNVIEPASVFTGIVIAGYGENDLFPKIQGFLVDGFWGNDLVFIKNYDRAISHKHNAIIVPFAQKDMVHVFMDGMLEDLQQVVGDQFKLKCTQAYENVLNKSNLSKRKKIDLSKEFRGAVYQQSENFMNDINTYIAEYVSSPTMQVVASLPKDELATMAETLVNLTSFKRKVSMDSETVGGPVDVLVISKGDGLVWIKRKFYFPKELNYSFYGNYNNLSGGGGDA